MSPFRMVSFLIVVSTSCIWQSCSTPIVTITRNDDPQLVLFDSPSGDDQEEKETFSQLISSILSPVFNKLLLLFLRELMSMMIGMELLTISSGGHFGMIVPQLTPEVDLELHRSAMAVMELWSQLPYVENVESALQKATTEVGELVGHSILKDVPVDPDVNQKIIQLVLEKTESKLKDDPFTYKKFSEIKNRVSSEFITLEDHRTYFAHNKKMTLKTEKKIFKQWFSQLRMRKFLVNKLFAEQCLKHVPHTESPEYESILMAKALVRLAKIEEKTVDVNRVYQEVVNQLAEDFDVEKYQFASRSSSLGGFSPGDYANVTIPVLFKRLNDRFSENATMYTELLKQRSNVIGDAFIAEFPMPKTGFW